MAFTYFNLLIFFGAVFAALGAMWKIGVVPTEGFRLIGRDNPDAFDAAMTILCVLLAGMLVVALFGVWAEKNSARLMREAEQARVTTHVR